ncbi:DoxX family membrane protein [Chondrinema litorale]|uniref:DoxX family membrane protein n=1 Tax=Chondrinema litorale TaxID=2994555 RepID=UPI002542B53C|nr:DoxX family membrane protein [Chondrinema litorale]UZR95573.1 DoxX family membrane protein [Chondrinema litorale]
MSLLKVLEGELSVQILTAAILAILFLQSGLDKIFDWKGNLDWLKSHFGSSPLKSVVPLLLTIITITEVTAGLLSAIGVIMLLTSGDTTIAMLGAQISALSIVMLFFGQRIAKDYAGAATLVPYFILAIFGILILN